MSEFMGYEVGGLATQTGDLFGYEVIDRAGGEQSFSGDDIALLQGPTGAAEFCNGSIRQCVEGEQLTLRAENDYLVVTGRWSKVA